MANSCCVLLAAIAAAGGASAQEDREVRGAILLTADKTQASTIKEDFLTFDWVQHESWDAFAKRFSTSRYAIYKWGLRSAVLLDMQTGPLGALRAKVDTIQSLLKKLGPDATIDVSKLTPNEIDEFSLGQMIGPEGESRGSLGLTSCLLLNVTRGSESKSSALTFPNDATKHRDEALDHDLFRAVPPKSGSAPRPDPIMGDEAPFYLLGIANGKFTEALKEVAVHIEQNEIRLREELRIASNELLKKLGQNGSKIREGKMSLNDLPDEVKNELIKTFASSWRGLGFAGASEAQDFLLNSDAVQVSTQLGMKFSIRSADPEHHIGGASGTMVFAIIPGGIAP